MLPSLLDFHPEVFGLPPFTDAVAGTIPLDPVWRIAGTVIRGFGRGSKVCRARCAARNAPGCLSIIALFLPSRPQPPCRWMRASTQVAVLTLSWHCVAAHFATLLQVAASADAGRDDLLTE